MTDQLPAAAITVALIGDGELPRAVEASLLRAGAAVRAMRRPSDREIGRLADMELDAVLIVSRDDIHALRLALLVEHARPGGALIVTLFDRTVAQQLRTAAPGCRVMSLADMVAPTLAGPCLADDILGLLRVDTGMVAARASPAGVELTAIELQGPRTWWWAAAARLVPRPFDTSSRFLVAGIGGFTAIIVCDFVLGTLQLRESPTEAAYAAVKALVTVGPNPEVEHAAGWVRLVAAALMICAVGFAAVLTAGIVNRLLDPRLTGTLGWRKVPLRDHVIVVGLGQVGLRLCVFLRDLGVPVVAVERRADAPCVSLARNYRIPVVVGSGGDRFVLQRLRIGRARALAAVTSDDLENVAIAVAALALDDGVRVVLRAGDGDVATETRALFRIGLVRDLHRIAADVLAATAMGSDAIGAVPRDGETWIAVSGGPEPVLLEPVPARSSSPG